MKDEEIKLLETHANAWMLELMDLKNKENRSKNIWE